MTKKSTKAAAVLEMLNKGMSSKEIRERFNVSPSYLWKLKQSMAHKAKEDLSETLYQITRGRQARKADAAPKPGEYIETEGQLTPNEIDAILDQRASNYGSFMQSSDTAVKIKGIIHNALVRNETHMFPDQMIALDMIAMKISRIVNGNAAHVDSWVDIAGYAKLVADRLQGNVR